MKNKSIASLSLRKLVLSALVAAPLATLPVPLWALPSSATNLASQVNSVSSGVSVAWGSANQVNVTSSATNSVIKWNDFGDGTNMTIVAGDQINYTLPSTSSSILNMVTSTGGTHATTINGTLTTTSGGNIYILNPNGITVGPTGVISATGVGLSTIPETEYNFLVSGTLTYFASSTPTGAINISPGAVITAASGTGNVWINSAGANLAGTIDAGNVSVATQNNGSVLLGSDGTTAGTLVIGDTVAKASNFSVTTTGTGTITVGTATSNVTVYGPSASLTTGNSTIGQAAGSVFQIGAGGSANATLTTNSGTANTTLDQSVQAAGTGTLTVNATGAAVTVKDASSSLVIGATTSSDLNAITTAGNLTINASTVGGNLVANSSGKISSGGNSTVTGTGSFTAGNGKDISVAGKYTGGLATVIAQGGAGTALGNVTLNSTDVLVIPTLKATNLSATAAKNITQSGIQTVTGGNVTISSSLAVTLSQVIDAKILSVTSGGGKDISQTADLSGITGSGTAVTFNAAGNASLAQLSPVTLTVTAGGNVTLGNTVSVTTGNITAGGAVNFNAGVTAATLNATGATLAETGTITSSGTATLNGTTSITLGGNNDFGTLVLKNAPSGASVKDINGVIIGGGTNTTGNATITASATTAGDVQFGAAAGDLITFGGNVTIDDTTTANGNITDVTNNLTVLGSSWFKTAGTGVVTLDGNSGNGIGLNSQYGQVNIATANSNATVFESTTLNLGNVTTGTGSLTAYSATSIINSDRLSVGNILVGAGTASNPGDIALNYDSSTVHNLITGTITLGTDLGLLGSSSVGTYLAKSLTVTNGISNAALVSITPNIYSAGATANVSLTAVGAANLGVGALNTTGTVTLASGTGSITATNAGNTFGTVTVTSGNTTGGSAISSTKDLTVNGTISGSQAITFSSTGNVTIGSYTSSDSAATSFTATKALADSVSGISIYGDVSFGGSSISITKAGHNFGKITATTTSNGSATIVESGTSNYASVSTGSGAFSATSANGDIVENGGAGTITTTGTATLSAPNGSVTLDGANSLGGTVALTAANSGKIINTGNTALGNITVASGGLTVDLTGTANKNITQASGAKVYTYGATAFKTAGTGTITVANSGNQFGGITLATANSAATVKESTTLNLASVAVGTGNLTVTSENGNIIDSGTVTAAGTTAFSTPNGSILLTKTASDFGTVTLNATGNVTISDANSIVLDTSAIGGTIAVTAGTGSISQLGALTVSGASTFTAASGALTLNNSANQFGAFKFKVGAASIIDEATTFNLVAGSYSNAPVSITTGGNFVTSGTGASSFTNNLTLNATGTIVPSAGSLLVTGTFTVYSNSTKDLSALSLSGNLAGNAPVNAGSGTYIAPSP